MKNKMKNFAIGTFAAAFFFVSALGLTGCGGKKPSANWEFSRKALC